MAINTIAITGRLARDPELRYTPAEGVAVVNFTLAVDRPFTNQQGEKEADFIRVVAWRKQAENVATYLKKGSPAGVEGRLQIRSYDDKEGIKRQVAEIIARSVQFLGSKQENNGANNGPDEYVGDEDVPF